MLRRYFGLILIVIMTIGGGVAEALRDGLWLRYRRYASPYLGPVPPSPAPAPLAPRTVVILVRDLGVALSRGMNTLNTLREQGADITLVQAGPTYRLPALMTLLSGARAEIHGFTTNETAGKVAPDNLARSALAARRTTVVIGGQIWDDALGNDIQRFELAQAADAAQTDADAVRIAIETLNSRIAPVQLLIVELQGLTVRDDPRAAERVDAAVKAIAEAAGVLPNPANPRAGVVLLVIGDRGVLANGADGGDEDEIARIPLVMAGTAIKPGTRFSARATSFAPTVSALAGLGLPAQSEGTVLSAALDRAPLGAAAAQLATFYEAWSEAARRPRFAAEMYRAAQGPLSANSEAAYQSFAISLRSAADASREGRLNMERAQRIPVIVGAGLLIIALAGLCLSAGGWRALAGAILILAGGYALFAIGRGNAFSLTVAPGGSALPFFTETGRDAAVVFGIVALLIGATTGPLNDVLEAVTAAISGLGLAILTMTCIPLYYYLQYGASLAWALPDPPILVASLTALTGAAAVDLRILPGNLPIPLSAVLAVGVALVYLLTRRR